MHLVDWWADDLDGDHQPEAIRDGVLAVVREDNTGVEISADGRTDDEDHLNFERLSWQRQVVPANGPAQRTAGVLVMVTDRVRRPSTVVGRTTIAATHADHQVTFHVHADRALAIKVCTDTPCTTLRVARGDHELEIDDTGELAVVAGGATVHLRLVTVDDGRSFPAPTKL